MKRIAWDNRDLQAAIKTDRSQYAGNRAVEIILTLTNISNRRVAVSTGRNLLYAFTIRDARTSRTIFTGPNRNDSPRTSGFTLQPGQTLTYREFWDRKDANGKRVPSGVYRIEARMYPQDMISTQIYLADGVNDGPGGQSPSEPGIPPGQGVPPSNPPGQAVDGFSATLSVDKPRAHVGDTVTLTYTVSNMSARPRVLSFTSGQRFEMVALSNRVQQWQWSQDKRFGLSLGSVTFEPQEQKTFTASWRISQGTSSGPCQLTAYLTVRGVPTGAACRAAATIHVQP